MPSQQPPAWFARQAADTSSPQFKERLAALEKELPDRLESSKGRGRASRFLPFLMIRSVLGDRGDRPFNVPFWESPDIWTAPGSPNASPEVPPTHGGTVTAGQPNTVYAHVWNVGRAPMAGATVEFYWANPSLSIDASHVQEIGIARVDLAARGMTGSHKLVMCPRAWTPVMENGGHECLIARIAGVGDSIGNNPWDPWLNRHVAQRNVSVVNDPTASASLLATLSQIRFGSRIELIQLSAKEGDLASKIVAPHTVVDPAVATRVLGQITLDSEVNVVTPTEMPAGTFATVHPLIHGGPPAAPPIPAHDAPTVPTARLAHGVNTADASLRVVSLVNEISNLHAGGLLLPEPSVGQAHVIRLANYDGAGQLVGGYTLVQAPS